MHLCPIVSMLHVVFYTVKSAKASFGLDRLYFLCWLILVGIAFVFGPIRQASQRKKTLQASFMPEGYFKMQDQEANKSEQAV